MALAAANIGLDAEVLDTYARFAHACKNNPLLWAQRAYPWGVKGTPLEHRELSPWQIEVLDHIGIELRAMASGEKPWMPVRVAVASGHGVGKSALMAMINDWNLATMPLARGMTTANTELQLRDKTWPELGKWCRMSVSRSFFNHTATTLVTIEQDKIKNWATTSVPWSENNPDAFQGLHNAGLRVCLLMDEASGIPKVIFQAIQGAMTDKDTQILWIVFGNPLRNSGPFYECFHKYKKLWKRWSIDSRTVDGTNLELFAEQIEVHGIDSDFVKTRILGQFPAASAEQFISKAWLVEAMGRKPFCLDDDPLICGLDFARSGLCSNVLYWRKGRDGKTIAPDIYDDMPDTTELVAKVVNRLNDMRPDVIMGDGNGVGGPIIDRLNQLGFVVIDVQAGGKSSDPTRYLNKRAEMAAKAKQWIRDGGALWENDEFFDEMVAIQTVPNVKGLLQIESKESLLKRGEPSPDVWDAFNQTFAYDTTEQISAEYQEAQLLTRARTEYDEWEGLDDLRSDKADKDQQRYDWAKRRLAQRRHYTKGDS